MIQCRPACMQGGCYRGSSILLWLCICFVFVLIVSFSTLLLACQRGQSCMRITLPRLLTQLFFWGRKKIYFDCFHRRAKVRNWNDHSNCTIWITQCTHEWSNCDIWITQCTHERPNLEFCISEWEKNVWVPCQSNMHGARISCTSVHMQRAIYRRKWLEGHVAPPPQITI